MDETLEEEDVAVRDDVVSVLTEVDEVDVAVPKTRAVGQEAGSIWQSPANSSQQQKRAQPVLGTAVAQVDPPVSSSTARRACKTWTLNTSVQKTTTI